MTKQQRCCCNSWSKAKKAQFYHQKQIDVLKRGCTLPTQSNNFLHKSTNGKFYPFWESDADLSKKIRTDLTDGPLIVFTKKTIVNKNSIRDLSNICNSIVRMDERQIHPDSKCQSLSTWLCTKWELKGLCKNSRLGITVVL